MEINVVKHLTNLCRICFGKGQYNLWEYKVKLPLCEDSLYRQSTMNENFSLDKEMIKDELTVQEMLESFSQNQTESVGSNTIQLICHPCLDELIPSFMFVQKVKFADKKIAQLSKEEVKMEMDLEGEQTIEYLEEPQDELINENYELENENQENMITIAETILDERKLEKEHVEILRDNATTEKFEAEHTASSKSNGQKRKVAAKNPTFVLTGGVTQMLAHINRGSDTNKPTRSATSLTKASSQKRFKTQREKQNQQPSPAPLEQGSFVVTQFIPSTAQIQLETVYSNEEQLKDGLTADYTTPCNELRTMDYAAVEIQCSSDLQVNETDNYVSNQNDRINENDSGCGGDPNNLQPIYVCKYCPQAFSAAHFLIAHARKSHVCKFCTQAFCKTTELYEHIRSTHTEHRCAICGKELSTHSNLRGHIKRVHGVKLPAQVALLDYRRRNSVLSVHHQASEDKHDFEASINTIDVAEENDKNKLSFDQQQGDIEFENDIHLMEQDVAATVDIVDKRQIINYTDNGI